MTALSLVRGLQKFGKKIEIYLKILYAKLINSTTLMPNIKGSIR